MLSKKILPALSLLCLASLGQAQYFTVQDSTTGKKGLQHRETKQLTIPFEFDDVRLAKLGDSLVWVQQGRLKGIWSTSGRQLLPVQFREIQLLSADKGFAPGYAKVCGENSSSKNRWGLARLEQGLVLPMEYDEVASIFHDLLSARKYRVDTLHFFNGSGQFLFSRNGETLKRGFDQNTLLITRRDGSSWYMDKKGNPVFSDKVLNPIWSDGELIICGNKGSMGIITRQLDTILPFSYTAVIPFDNTRFFVSLPDGRTGMVDASGRFVIPAGDYLVRRLVADSSSAFVTKGKRDYSDNIYDRHGKLLVSGCRIENTKFEMNLAGKMPGQQADNYFLVKMQGSQLVGFFHKDGRQILPPEYEYIIYCSEAHPLIARTKDKESGKVGLLQAFDLSGKQLLRARFRTLFYTKNPGLLFGLSDAEGKWGFVNLEKPKQARFEFDYIARLESFYHSVKMGQDYFLYDENGRKLSDSPFNYLGNPQTRQLDFFTGRGKGQLVAVASKSSQASGAWIGLNEKGEEFEFGSLPEEEIQVEEVFSVEAVAMPPANTPKIASDEIFTHSDTPPSFPGGEEALRQFIREKLVYPAIALENRIEGQVTLSFVVEPNGQLSQLQIKRDIGANCGKEALRLASLMPAWQPGTIGGRAVRVLHALRVDFKIP
jgi:TonB family protein